MMNMRHFLSEMGGDFAFVGNQFKLEVGAENFYVDIFQTNRRFVGRRPDIRSFRRTGQI